MTEISRTIIHKAPASLAAPLPARVASANMAAGTRIRTRKVSPSHTPRSALMIVSEVMSPPDCHDDPTTQHGLGSFRGGTSDARQLVFTSGQRRAKSSRADWML